MFGLNKKPKGPTFNELLPEETILLNKTEFTVIKKCIEENSKHITLDGDIAMNMQLDPDLRTPINCVQILYDKNENKTKEFALELANRLQEIGTQVRTRHEGAFIIDTPKDEKWHPTVAVCPKGLRFT